MEIKKLDLNVKEFDLNEIEFTQFDMLVFTTNGNRKKDGKAVMGKGIAKWVKDNLEFYHLGRFVSPDLALGQMLDEDGNIPFVFLARKKKNPKEMFLACSFPTKHNWWEKADLELIKESAKGLVKLTKRCKPKKVYIPLFGTENGGLSLEEVLPILKALEKVITAETIFFKKPKSVKEV